MQRTLSIKIDKSTWPKKPKLPAFPSEFVAGTTSYDFNIASMLLTIGYLTTPSHAAGVSLSEFWAWVRYLNAISDTPDLRLAKPFSELDAHQKTILSDDFGMGVPMSWLMDTLDLGLIADGRYFVDRVAATMGATTQKQAKRGPQKTPDFVARDGSGVWHVIECKGTQSGNDYRDRQLGGYNPQTGAVSQKNTIKFPAGHTGQRLACGLSIAVEGSSDASSLRIIDPPGLDEFVISQADLDLADDAIVRAIGSRALRLAGFPVTSTMMSAPDGPTPHSHALRGKRETTRQDFIASKVAKTDVELERRTSFGQFTANSENFRGRMMKIDLPSPIWIDGRLIRSVRIRWCE